MKLTIRHNSGENKNSWSYTSTSENVFIAECLIKLVHRDSFKVYDVPGPKLQTPVLIPVVTR